MAMTARSLSKMLRTLPAAVEADPMTEEFIELGALVRDESIQNFADEQDQDGNEWAPRKRKYDHPPLRETYAMYGAATVRGAPGALEEIANKRIAVGVQGSVIRYAKPQQDGAPSINLVARPYYYVRNAHLPNLLPPIQRGMRRIFFTHVRQYQDRLT